MKSRPQLLISLDTTSPATIAAASTLQQLVAHHKLLPFVCTNQVRIIAAGRSTSHPVLTLVARPECDSNVFLADFLHEQFHWFVASRSQGLRLAVSRFEQLHPRFAFLRPPLGAGSASLTYIHFVVCYLEQAAIRRILGHDVAHHVRMQAFQYLAVYDLIASHPEMILEVILECNLMHPALGDSAQSGRGGHCV